MLCANNRKLSNNVSLVSDTAVRTLNSLRNVCFNVVDDLSKEDIANEVFDEAIEQQRTETDRQTDRQTDRHCSSLISSFHLQSASYLLSLHDSIFYLIN